MNFIRWLTAGLTLLAGAVFVSLCVVCLQFYLYMDVEPSLHAELPGLVKYAVMFLALSLMGGMAWWSVLKQNRWMWPAQGILLAGSTVIFLLFWALLSNKV